MTPDHEIHALASRLVAELGDGAVRISRVKLVELIAANDLRAAAFWRGVLAASESLLARMAAPESSADETASQSPLSPPLR